MKRLFRIVYSLKLYSLAGREVVQEERIETEYYQLEDIDGLGSGQQAKMVH